MTTMSSTRVSSSHTTLTIVVASAALVVVLAVLSAFVWPGWALGRSDSDQTVATSAASSSGGTSASAEPTTPTISPSALPTDSTTLLKAMPESVLNFARTEASPSASWTSSSPLEEYTLTYSTGKEAQNVTMIVAQWTTSDSAKTQYDALVSAQKGTDIATGTIKVSGSATGSYVVREDASDSQQAVAIWQNDTAVFQVSGPRSSVLRFYQKFPL
ncbi:MAG: hypothetical protein LKF35_03840 [Bifidobacterium minimum]|nr:hypothetical protein [Bifidobacterium minimum]